MATYKDDVVRALVRRGWIKGSGGEVYFPESRRPHLHVSIESGFHTYRDMVSWIRFMVVSRGSEGRSTDLVRDGREIAGAISDLGDGEMKREAEAVCRMAAP